MMAPRSSAKHWRGFAGATALLAATLIVAPTSQAQNPDAAKPHRALAKAAAGDKFPGLYTATCGADDAAAAPAAAPARPRPAGGGPPDRSQWYAPPAQVFDNLYWVGT